MARAARQCSGCMSSCPGIPACCARGAKSGTAGLGQLSGNRFYWPGTEEAKHRCFQYVCILSYPSSVGVPVASRGCFCSCCLYLECHLSSSFHSLSLLSLPCYHFRDFFMSFLFLSCIIESQNP